MTHEERLAYQRERRKLTGNADIRKYEKSPNGFLMRMYRNMKSRVTGIQAKKAHLYLGKDILSKEEFYNWALNNPKFMEMFNVYTESNFTQKLAPTVDRIESSRGYTIDNMQWLTHSENSRKGSYSRYGIPNPNPCNS